jgi:uncharacterized membrane protein
MVILQWQFGLPEREPGLGSFAAMRIPASKFKAERSSSGLTGGRERMREWLEALGDVFWIRPALLVLSGVLLGEAMVLAEATNTKLPWVPDGWVYTGGEAGARALLGTVASSTIGVAGTTFSITVAALSLASGQMGPRLLRMSCPRFLWTPICPR